MAFLKKPCPRKARLKTAFPKSNRLKLARLKFARSKIGLPENWHVQTVTPKMGTTVICPPLIWLFEIVQPEMDLPEINTAI
jgi:hypothetical protein